MKAKTFKHDIFKDLMQKLNNDRRGPQRYCDVKILAGGHNFPVHKCVIGILSPFYDNVFFGQFKHEDPENQIMKETMERLLDFIYTGKLVITSEIVYDLIKASHFLDIPYIKDCCSAFLENEIDSENCVLMRSYVKKYGCESLIEKIDVTIGNNLTKLMVKNEFKELEIDEIKSLFINLKSKQLSSSETGFQALIGWIKHDVEARGQNVTNLMSFLDFQTMSWSFLNETVATESLIEMSHECTKMLLQVMRSYPDVRSSRSSSSDEHQPPPIAHKRSTSDVSIYQNVPKIQPRQRIPARQPPPVPTTKPPSVLKNNPPSLPTTNPPSTLTAKRPPVLKCKPQRSVILPFNESTPSVTSTDAEAKLEVATRQQTMVDELNSSFKKPRAVCKPRKSLKKIENIDQGGFAFFKEDKAWKFNVTSKALIELPRLKCNHGNGTMAVYRDELFVIGGKWANRVEKLNLKQQETDWTEIAPTIHRRCMSASAIWEETVCVVGGRAFNPTAHSSSASQSLSFAEAYNSVDDVWMNAGEETDGLYGHAVVTREDLLYTVGGEKSDAFKCFDVSVGKWQTLSPMSTERGGLAAVLLKNQVFAIGGRDGNNQSLTSVEKYSFETNSWSKVASLNVARSYHSACIVNQTIYVVGGNTNTMEVYDAAEDKWMESENLQQFYKIDDIVAL